MSRFSHSAHIAQPASSSVAAYEIRFASGLIESLEDPTAALPETTLAAIEAGSAHLVALDTDGAVRVVMGH